MAATQSASGVKNEPIWRSLPPRAADEEAYRKHYVITLRKCLVKVSFGDAGMEFWKLGKKISIECLLISSRKQTSNVNKDQSIQFVVRRNYKQLQYALVCLHVALSRVELS